ncbi:MAG: OmpA family protein [Pseudomonadota bacterium]
MTYSIKLRAITVLFAGVATFALGSCTGIDDPEFANTRAGAVIGGATAAAVTIATGGEPGQIAGAAILGAAVGGAIGNVIDKQERELRGDLAGSGATITRQGDRLIVTLPEAITFDTDSTFVRPSLQDDLRALAGNLNRYPNSTVDVVGHTDSVGDAAYNQNLSARRAASVTGILNGSGVDRSRIRSFGRGETAPIATNETAGGRAANRRVEVVINPKS